jgi:uncharacterized delta-60 repeat protein
MVLTDFGGGSFEAANALAVQSDGKIVAAGFSTTTPIPDFGLARYDPKGDLDRGFGVHGKVLTDFKGSGSVDVASAVAIQSDGKIVAAGYSDASGTPYDFALVRYNPNGTLDTTFHSSGKVLTDLSGSGSYDQAHALGIQSDGKIVAVGLSMASGNSDFAIARYNPNGTLDTTFNTTGKVLTDLSGAGSQDEASAVAIQSDGKIVAAGDSTVGGGNPDFALARYKADGTLDRAFNSTGRVLTDFGGFDVAYAVVIQSARRIVAGGFSDVSGSSDFALAGYFS